MRTTLRFAVLLLAWLTLLRTDVWAQCNTSSTTTFVTSTSAGNVDWKTRSLIGVPQAAGATRVTTLKPDNTSSYTSSNTSSSTIQTNAAGTPISWNSDFSAGNGTSALTFTFNRPLSNFTVQVGDVDATVDRNILNQITNAYTDQVVFTGANNGTAVTAPTVTSASGPTLVVIAGNTATGVNDNNTNTAATVTATFSQPITSLTITYRSGTIPVTDPGGQVITINQMTWCRLAPVANNITNSVTLPTSAGQVNLDALSSTVDGAVQSYTITAVPPVAQGVLYYNTTGSTYAAVTNNLVLTPAQAASLRFEPATNGTASSASFSYRVTDDANLLSANTATFTIPLQVITPCVATSTLSFATPRALAQDWKARTENVPATSSLTTVTSGSYQVPTSATVNTFETASFNGVQSLLWQMDYANTTANSSSVTFTFNRPVSNFTVRVQDIDKLEDASNSFTDRVTFTGANAGTAVVPVLSLVTPNANAVIINGNTATGTVNNTSPDNATVIAYFAEPITSLTLTYSNISTALANPTANAVGIDFMDWCRLAPIANNITNTSVSNAAGAAPVNGLSSVVDGTPTYTLTSLPAANQGILYVNGVAATVGQTLTAAQAAQLSFDPAVTFAGTVSFNYRVSDEAGQTATATYSIPVNASGAAGTAGPCATPGRDGSSTITTNPNTYYPSTAVQSLTAGVSNFLYVGPATGTSDIAVGDLLLIIQMQGSDINSTNSDAYGDGVTGGGANGTLNTNFTAGTYEYVVANSAVTAVAGGTIQLTSTLRNSYQNDYATATAGQRRFQVVRVPQYSNLTLGANISPLPWNGNVGGIIAVDVAKQTNLNGFTIDVSGAGFRGGAGRALGGATGAATDYRTSSALNANGTKGEGIAGTPRYVNNNNALLDTRTSINGLPTALNDGYPSGDNGRGAPGNAGGGGTDANPGANNQNTGGGGGANGGSGGRGGNAWASNAAVGGEPGAAFTAASSSRLVLGGGGGAGSTNDGTGTPGAGFASSGAAGGGIVMLRTGTISGTGSVLANGANANNTVANDGSGGGGAGGSILITAATPAGLSNLTLTANGGTGGTNTSTTHGPGGGGGGGVILTNAAVAASNVTAGTNGTTGGVAYGSEAGAVGGTNAQISTSIANSTSGANCPADVTTTISGPTTVNTNQASGSYSVTFTNNGTATASNVTRLVTLPAGATVTAAQLPAGATFTTTGNVTTIDFGTVASLASGAGNTFAFSYTTPPTSGSYSLTSTVGTDASQGGNTAPDVASLTIQVNGAPANCQPSYLNNTTVSSGLTAEYYAGYFNDDVNYFQRISPLRRLDAQLNFSVDNGINTWGDLSSVATGNSTNYDNYSSRYRGSIYIATAGTYTFYLGSDDASYMWLDGAALAPTIANATINNGGAHSYGTLQASVTLSAGPHDITVVFGEAGGNNNLRLEYENAALGIARQVIPSSLFCAGPAAANTPPVAQDATNTPLLNSAAATVLNPNLSGTDADGTLSYYNIVTLPSAASGVLAYNGVPVVTGQAIPAGSLNLLTFDPAAGFVGNASFTYAVTDNGGRADLTPNTYTIPVNGTTTIAGTVFEDVNYGGGAGRTLAASNGVGRSGATVELYNTSGALVATTTTTTGGAYSFAGVGSGTYSVRVVNSTVTSSRAGYVAGLIPVQTFVNGDVNRVGGEAPEKQDAAANTGSQTLAQLTAGTLTAQSVTSVTVAATPAPVSNVNFGFNFDVVTNTNNTGQGSLRQFITNANALGDEATLAQSGSNAAGALAAGKETSIFMIPSGSAVAGLRAGLVSGLTGGVAVIAPTAVLPTITGANTTIDGTTQTFNVGNTNNTTLGIGGSVGVTGTALSQVSGPEVQIVGGRANYNGLNTSAANTTFRGLSVYGFTDNINTDINAANVLIEQNVIGATATSFTDPGATARTIGEGINLTGSDDGIIRNNLIGFNGGMGVWLLGNTNGNNGANNNLVSNNEIRGNARETVAPPERLVYDGIELQGASTGNTISGNLITETLGHGIDSFGNTIGGNTISGNTISNNGQGVANNTGEEGAGIRMFSSTNLTTISGNVLSGNNGSGVFVVNSGNNVTISQNSIFGNTRLGIDLLSTAEGVNGNGNPNTWNGLTGAASNVTLNDNGDGDTGGNGLLNFPVITSATVQGTNLIVQGFARPGAVIEFFNPGTADASGFGEGQTYLGTFTEGSAADTNGGTGTYSGTINGLNQGTDNTNRFTFTIPLTGNFATVAAGSLLTSTATLANSTSEFSGNVTVNTAPIPQDVTNVAVPNNSGAVVLNPNLTATASGTGNSIASYTIVSLPASGTLAYNGVTLTSGNIATTVISDKNLLTYQPVAGFSGNVSFTYTATDANGVTSTTHRNQAGTAVTNGPATYTIPVSASADVTTTLAGPTNLNPGQATSTYTAAFTNNGPNPAVAVTQQVTLPAGATNVFVNGVAYTPTGNVIDFGTAASLAAGATNIFSFSFTAPTTPGSAAISSNVTTTTSQGVDTAPNTATLNATVGSPANVAATISAGAGSVTAGQSASFNVSFSNAGPATAAGVVASVQLPAGLGTVTASNGGVYDNATGIVTYAGITSYNSGGSTTSVISFTAPTSGPVTATASIRTTTSEAGQTANNTQSASISVTPTYDVTTSITGPTSTAVGVQTTFSVMTINNGPSMAPSVVQTVTGLPTNLTNVYVSNGGTYNAATGTVTFPALEAMANGARVDNTISFTPTTANATGFTATATATANGTNPGDSNTGNNSVAASAMVVNAAPAASTNANIYTTITAPSANVLPGDVVTFTVTSGNRGAATATSVAQQTTLPAGLSNVVVRDANNNVVPNTATTGYNSATGLVVVPAVASVLSGTTTSYSVSFTAPASGMVAGVATISSANADSMPADNISTADVTVMPATDLVVRLTGPASVVSGSSATYTVTTTNNGPATATNVATTVSIPAGLTGVVVSGGGTYNAATGVVTFPATASLLNGSATSNTITYTEPNMGTVRNVASATSTTMDNQPTNNTASVTTQVKGMSDVTVALNGPATIVQGNQVDYVVSAINNGQATAANTVIRVQLPTGLSNVVSTNGSYNATTGVVTFSTIASQPAGRDGAVSYGIRFVAPSTLTSLYAAATVSTDSEEISYTNNTATTTTAVAAPTTGQADLQIAVTPSTNSPVAGQSMTLNVVTTNLAASTTAATNVVTRVSIEPGLTVTSITNGGTYDPATGVVTFPALSSLAVGASVPNSVVFVVPGATPLTTRGLVSGDQSDPSAANNVDFQSLTVSQRADVTTTISGPATTQPGDLVTYSVTTLNNGPSVANGVVQKVTIPAGATNVVISGGGTLSGNEVTFPTINNQVAGVNGAVVNTISFNAPATIAAPYSVVANVTTTSTQPTTPGTANDVATVTTARGNRAPVANAVVNSLRTPEGNTAGALAISPLSGTDADGNATITSYTITSIPDATTQGVLRLNGTPVAAGALVNAADVANLTFDPVASFVGNAFFTYTATDNAGAVSAPATYTIPVGQDISAVYTLTTPKGGATPYQNGDVIANVFDVNGGSYNSAAPQAVTNTGIQTATLTSGTLPAGTTLDPVTGIITVTNRLALVAGSYPVTVTTVDAYGGTNTSTFTIVIGARPLPVELATFDVRAVKVDALLDWTTASEKNNDRFEVERSLNGSTFEKIGTVRGQGTTQATTPYNFKDAGIGARTQDLVYYRLRQVDLDGTVSYSPVRMVRFEAQAAVTAKLSVFPNPATTADRVVTLDLSTLPKGNYQALLVDAAGRILGTYPVEGGINKTVDVQNLPTGTYIIQVRGNGLKLSERLLKE